MCPYFEIGVMKLPAYGSMIFLGIFLANIIAFHLSKKRQLSFDDLLLCEAYCGLGAFFGAKLLYILVSFPYIEWNRMAELQYFIAIIGSGFVFYGGLIGGIGALFLCGKLHKINIGLYAANYAFLIPFGHAFGRIGCFLAGCCYGKPYEGIGAVVYPEYSFAISGISLFPVQLVEAVLLFLISAVVFIVQMKKGIKYNLEIYLVLYAIVRMILEYFRYDAIRGSFLFFSTSQWISIAIILGVIGKLIWEKHGKSRKKQRSDSEE
ncbi:MAG: prolipoprotein diacylglyceryl transferase [Lachnospiraceae bacterium]